MLCIVNVSTIIYITQEFFPQIVQTEDKSEC